MLLQIGFAIGIAAIVGGSMDAKLRRPSLAMAAFAIAIQLMGLIAPVKTAYPPDPSYAEAAPVMTGNVVAMYGYGIETWTGTGR